MVRTVFIDTDVITNQLDSLPKNRFAFGFLCGQCTRAERDYIHYIIDGVPSNQTDIDSFFDSSSTNRELWAKIIEITSSLCAGVSIVGFYCRAKAETLKSTNFTLKMRRLFEILQNALQTYSPWSLNQSAHRILLQSELNNGPNKWLVKTMDLSASNVHFRPVEMKTFDSRTQTNWCLTTTIPLQWNLWLSDFDLKIDENIKKLEKEFEQQWKIYVDQFKGSLLLMDDRLIPDENFKFPSKSNDHSFDIQWLSPLDGPLLQENLTENRLCYRLEGSAALRLFTCHAEMSGNDLREYFLEDLFRSMLIRMNLALINNENTSNEKETLTKLVLPRRIYANRPVFVSGYQLLHETFPMVIESLQENFKITSLMEEDLEVAEQFPPTLNNDGQTQPSNSDLQNSGIGQLYTPPRSNQNPWTMLTNSFGTGNTVLAIALSAFVALLISIMIKLFT